MDEDIFYSVLADLDIQPHLFEPECMAEKNAAESGTLCSNWPLMLTETFENLAWAAFL